MLSIEQRNKKENWKLIRTPVFKISWSSKVKAQEIDISIKNESRKDFLSVNELQDKYIQALSEV